MVIYICDNCFNCLLDKYSSCLVGSCFITNSSSGIHNAWHFYYALIFLIKVVCGGIGIALLTP
ncbi:TPA: DUF3265 domain-containing protein [Vibrio vulnificus]|nr:DUF3265 domain-containing protein [Vibrio vulnificus]